MIQNSCVILFSANSFDMIFAECADIYIISCLWTVLFSNAEPLTIMDEPTQVINAAASK